MSSTLIVHLGLNVYMFASITGTQLLAGRSLLLHSRSRYLDEMDVHLCMYFHFHIYYSLSRLSLSNICNGLYLLMYYLDNTLSPSLFHILLICAVSEMKFY